MPQPIWKNSNKTRPSGVLTPFPLASGRTFDPAADLTARIPTLLSDDETETTGSGTNASAKSFALQGNKYSRILIQSEVTYDFVAAAVELTFEILVGGVSKRSVSVRTASTSGFTFTVPLVHALVQQATATIAISVTQVTGTPTWRIRSLRVWGIS